MQIPKQPRKQQRHNRVDMRSDWSDSDDGKDNQARKRPIVHHVTSDWETDMDEKTTAAAPLR